MEILGRPVRKELSQVQVLVRSGDYFFVDFAHDLSTTGVCIYSILLLEINSDLALRIHLGQNKNEKITAKGRIKWANKDKAGYKYGIEFVNITSEHKKKIEEYIV